MAQILEIDGVRIDTNPDFKIKHDDSRVGEYIQIEESPSEEFPICIIVGDNHECNDIYLSQKQAKQLIKHLIKLTTPYGFIL